jgi:site-specific DNA-methyltransferase (adenine-specific)
MSQFKTDLLDLRLCDNMELMAQYPDKHFELAIVDPPYGIGEDGCKNHSRGKATKATKYTPKNWDKQPPNQEYFNELFRVSKNQIIWGANYMIDKIQKPSMGWIFWDKGMEFQDFSDGELAYTSFEKALKKYRFVWNGMLQGDMKNKETRIHPTQKPTQLYKWLLHNYAKQGDKILDTHLGSMSIAIACHDYGYHLTGCELDHDYFADGIKRVNSHIKQLSLFA